MAKIMIVHYDEGKYLDGEPNGRRVFYVLRDMVPISAAATTVVSSFRHSLNIGQANPGFASIISPPKGSQLASSKVTLSWTAETGATVLVEVASTRVRETVAGQTLARYKQSQFRPRL
jgi:hypothetical protein